SERWADSVDALKMASDKNPQNVEIWVKLGEADYFRSLYQDAAKSFLRALRINPNHTYALFYLGRCMEYRGNENHALRVYRKLLDLNPTNPEILEELSKSFHRLGSTDAAERAKRFASLHRKSKPK
ncbi:MAG: tetratricopeptide repeat protein, partial [Candidatus Thorarchaeota archaeon]|nr:tetratricopeptide repeat protein [Candidatus Thorarchaeota archaeon]